MHTILYLTKLYQEKRLKWAKGSVLRRTFWRWIVFSNEKKFNLDRFDRFTYCCDFRSSGLCMRRDALESEKEIHLKITSFLVRTTMVSKAKRLCTSRESVRITYIIGDKYLGWFAFRHDFIGTITSACSLITLDCRRKRFRNPVKHGIECQICDDAVSNVGLCSNASIVHSLCESFMEQDSSAYVHELGMKSDG